VSATPTTRLRLLGILFWLAGGTCLAFGWMGMAELAYVDGQMPYLVSGGAAGLALVLVGSTLIISAALADAAERTAQRTAELLKLAADEAVEAAEEARKEAENETGKEAEKASAEPEDAEKTAA